MECDTEVYNLFAGLLSQEGLAELGGKERKQQGLVPDFQIDEGLAELKIIGCCPAHYPGTGGVRPVERRAAQIQKEYEDKLRDVDQPHGPALARLHSYGPVKGLVVGAFGEFSDDLHALVDGLVKAKLPGPPELNKAARSVVYPYLRRRIAVAAVKGHAKLLLDGLKWCGPGGKEAYSRRHDRKVSDGLAAAAMRAEWAAHFHRVDSPFRGH